MTTHRIAYRLPMAMLALVAAVSVLLGWFAWSVATDPAGFQDYASHASRGRFLGAFPPGVVVAGIVAVELLMLVPVLLTLRAARADRTLLEIGPDGVTHHGLMGRVSRLPWGAMAGADWQPNMVTFRAAPGGGARKVAASLIGQDRAAVHAAVRAHRPDLAPPG